MNEIVIIGNGFDRAHGLPTDVNDFMSWLMWTMVEEEDSNDSTEKTIKYKVQRSNRSFPNFRSRLIDKNTPDPWIGLKINDSLRGEYEFCSNPEKESILFSSLFNNFKELGCWYHFENHYFRLLKSLSLNSTIRSDKIQILNQEFDHLKILLKQYLKERVEDFIGFGKRMQATKNNSIYQMLLEGSNNYMYDFKERFFISFNYTSKILQQYVHWLRFSTKSFSVPIDPIHIHGDLVDENNPIIFGYVDENTDAYSKIESSGNNDLLKNFKTFQYLRSNRYRETLALLEKDKEIYVQIIGHSCGLCDKALLRTIFEHPNVKHIEYTYHKNENKYFENLYNLSRIFDDNTIMRQKVIPLEDTFCLDK